jgi:uncharacterized membrane protein YkvA (DUF1232 family)
MEKLPIPVPAAMRRDERAVRRGFWKKMRRVAARTGFAREAMAAYYCTRDPATPIQVKAILLSALAYFVMPADMIPDFVAGLGFTDDLAVLLTAWRVVGPAIKESHRERADAALARLATRHETAA